MIIPPTGCDHRSSDGHRNILYFDDYPDAGHFAFLILRLFF
ncbi:MAG: hypothetical protein ABH808_02195 [Candidatus Kuenenbacteria bacterium]